MDAHEYFELSSHQNTGDTHEITEATFRAALTGLSLEELTPVKPMERIPTAVSGTITITAQSYHSAPDTPQIWLEAYAGSPEAQKLIASARLSWKRGRDGHPAPPWLRPHSWPTEKDTERRIT